MLVMFPELHRMVQSLSGALKAVFWGMVLIAFSMTLCSIAAVHIIHPLNEEVARQGHYDDCSRCARAFETVLQSNLTFLQQYIAGDAWGEVTMPIIDMYPWTGVFFVSVLVLQSLLNLILGMIVDGAQEARQECIHEQAMAKEKDRATARKMFLKICDEIDTEYSGHLTLETIIRGYDENPNFAAALTAMDIQRSDMETVFDIMDEEGRGMVAYEDFAAQLYMMKSSDSHTMLVFIKHYVRDIHSRLSEQLKAVEEDLYTTMQSNIDTILSPQLSLAARERMDPIHEETLRARWVGSPTCAIDVAEVELRDETVARRSRRWVGTPRIGSCSPALAEESPQGHPLAEPTGKKAERTSGEACMGPELAEGLIAAIQNITDKSEANSIILEAIRETLPEMVASLRQSADVLRTRPCKSCSNSDFAACRGSSSCSLDRKQPTGDLMVPDDSGSKDWPLLLCKEVKASENVDRVRASPSPLRRTDDRDRQFA